MRRSTRWAVPSAALALTAGAMVPIPGETAPPRPAGDGKEAAMIDLSALSAAPPERDLDLLFIHHSTGGQLLADPGPLAGGQSIHPSHPNGGGLRALLEEAGYRVHEASYGSEVGEHTDLGDWPPKFRDRMDRVVRVRRQDELLPEGDRNEIVLFKSCFPNNAFRAMGTSPGDPSVPELTVENARASLRALLPLFRRRPETLFVYLTAPPLAPRLPSERAWRFVAKRILGRGETMATRLSSARLARTFNDWAKDPDGWLAGYDLPNVVVFDYYDVLTEGRGDLSAHPSGDGSDSHPSSEGQRRAAGRLVPFLNRAVRRAGLSP